MKRPITVACLSALSWTAPALAEDARVHLAAGGAHALGGTQQSEFGPGGAGTGTLELPVTGRAGVQASAGALILSKGSAPKDPSIAEHGAGSAFLGTIGMRLRAYGASRVAGPWIDGNVGVAQTSVSMRPAFDAHIGWDVRVSHSSRIDVGPFVGYTQIFQHESALRNSDARILTAGISVSLGATERARPAEPPSVEPLPPPVPYVVEPPAAPVAAPAPPSCTDDCVDTVRVVENKIILDDVVHFEFDRARIREESHRLVRKVARYLQAHSEIVAISIEGHADEVGAEEYNRKLSEDRAASMRDLLAKFGVAPDRMQIIGYGKSRPRVASARPELRNRRVELVVTTAEGKGRTSK
jgi:outer membrane protein OmpA-like peptidoglycan-associated protein